MPSVKVLWPCEAIAYVTDKRVRVWIHNPSIFLIAIPAYILVVGLVFGLGSEAFGLAPTKALITWPLTFIQNNPWVCPIALVAWFMRVTTVTVDRDSVVIRHYTGVRVWEEVHANRAFTFPHVYNNRDERNWDQGGFEDLPSLVGKPAKSLITRRIRNALEFIDWIDTQARRLEAEGKKP